MIDGEHDGVQLSPDQLTQLPKVVPTGVCDYSKPADGGDGSDGTWTRDLRRDRVARGAEACL